VPPDVVQWRSFALELAMSRFLRWSPSSRESSWVAYAIYAIAVIPLLGQARVASVLSRGSAGRPHKPV
ncbi:hypothetical protein PpBr36_08381, partial [Pyricularia pennisetigena]|uniref:hypothetical protein n=1 Tax=Pyricularia pennisetigena TaxID=1578925 RepID=UPI00115359B3